MRAGTERATGDGDPPPASPAAVLEARARWLAAARRTVAEFRRDPAPDPEAVHRLHVELRRLRAAGRIARRGLRRGPARRHRQVLERRLAAIARSVGEIRDLDQKVLRVGTPPRGREPPRERRRREELLDRLRDEARIGREIVKARLRAEEGLFEELARRPPPSALRAVPGLRSRRRPRRLAAAYRRARRRPGTERIHRLRIRLREHRHRSELLREGAPGPPTAAFPAGLHRLLHRLGRVHDLALLWSWLTTEEPLPPEGVWGRELHSELRAERRRLAAELRRPSVARELRPR